MNGNTVSAIIIELSNLFLQGLSAGVLCVLRTQIVQPIMSL